MTSVLGSLLGAARPLVEVIHGDALEELRLLPAASVDAVITDPPYELGFMGKSWDAVGIAYSVELWAECLRALRPGGYLASFGGTRTYHRMACAVEDAGFHIQDSLIWLHGQGFPKGKSQLKPAQEPIVLARKRGVGALNIDATRTGLDGMQTHRANYSPSGKIGFSGADSDRQGGAYNPQGRWPANVLLTHSPECDGVCVAGCPVAELDAQSGTSTTSKPGQVKRSKPHGTDAMAGTLGTLDRAEVAYGDTGGASRYFPTFRYQAKAPTRERPKVDGIAHPTVKPLALMQWLVRLLCPPGGVVLDPFAGSGTTVEACIDEGMSVIGIEREAEYLPHIQVRIDRARARQTPPPAGDLLALFEVG